MIHKQPSLLMMHRLIFCLTFIGIAFSNTGFGVPEPNKNKTHTWDNAITIPTLLSPYNLNSEPIELPANIFVPLSKVPQRGFPAVIFINSWALNEFEYLPQARKYADSGYIVLSYTTRGFRGAPGLVDTAGPKDIGDTSAAIDWLIDNYPVNPEAIALAGVSYGAGIALLTATQDERVAAVVSMSTWGSLIKSLWGGQTPQETWLDILLAAVGWPIGYADPEIREMANNMFAHKNVVETIEWGNVRSPINYIDQINKQQHPPAIYVSNNLQDYLFQPNSIIEFLSQYKGPWRVDFNVGVHGQGEASGLAGSDTSYPWVNAKAWLDHYLKGASNGIDTLSKVNTIVHSRTSGTRSLRESFDNFPITADENDITFSLIPQGGNTGILEVPSPGLIPSTPPSVTMLIEQTINTTDAYVGSGGVAGATLGAALQFVFEKISPENALIFLSPALEKTIYLRGSATVKFWSLVEHNTQFFAYLLAYNENSGKASWIGHSPFSWHLPEGESLPPDEPIEITMEFYWTANDIDKGEKLLLVIDGNDGDYWRYSDTPDTNTFIFGENYPARIVIPRTLEIAPFKSLNNPTGEAHSRGSNGDKINGGSAGSYDAFILMVICLLLLIRKITSYASAASVLGVSNKIH